MSKWRFRLMETNVKRVQLLDKGYLELVDQMPHEQPDFAIVQAARVSHLEGSKGEEKDAKLLRYLMQNGHTSPFEMAEFKWRVYAPLVTYWHWTRHRTWNFNAQSGRYTPFEENDFYIPSEWRLQSLTNHQASDGVMTGVSDLANQQAAWLTQDLKDHYARSYSLYKKALSYSVSREMARFFLPGFSVFYSFIVKCDLKNTMDFLRLRMADDAQHEIRVYALAMFGLIREQAPICMSLFEELKIRPDREHFKEFYRVFGR